MMGLVCACLLALAGPSAPGMARVCALASFLPVPVAGFRTVPVSFLAVVVASRAVTVDRPYVFVFRVWVVAWLVALGPATALGAPDLWASGGGSHDCWQLLCPLEHSCWRRYCGEEN